MQALRRDEMAAAAEALGVQHRWLGFVDSGLPEGDPLPPLPEGCFALVPLEEAAAPLVELVRSFKPHVITTYDENGGYPHPDHIMCHKVSVEAFEAAGDPERYVGRGEPWTPQKLYYNGGFSLVRMRAIHEALLEAGRESPFGEWIESREARATPEREVTTRIPVSDYFEHRDAALRAHATQIDPDGFFFAMPREVELASGRPRIRARTVAGPDEPSGGRPVRRVAGRRFVIHLLVQPARPVADRRHDRRDPRGLAGVPRVRLHVPGGHRGGLLVPVADQADASGRPPGQAARSRRGRLATRSPTTRRALDVGLTRGAAARGRPGWSTIPTPTSTGRPR